MRFPEFKKIDRISEYNSYSITVRADIVYAYLFEGFSHRKLDKEIIGLDPDKSKGWQSMGVLRYLGLFNDHKGVFKDISLSMAINFLRESENYAKYDLLLNHLEIYRSQCIDINKLKEELILKVSRSARDSQ